MGEASLTTAFYLSTVTCSNGGGQTGAYSEVGWEGDEIRPGNQRRQNDYGKKTFLFLTSAQCARSPSALSPSQT